MPQQQRGLEWLGTEGLRLGPVLGQPLLMFC